MTAIGRGLIKIFTLRRRRGDNYYLNYRTTLAALMSRKFFSLARGMIGKQHFMSAGTGQLSCLYHRYR